MRMTASWSGSNGSYRIQVCGARSAPNGELPLGSSAHRHRTRSFAKKPSVAVHPPSACSAIKALRNTSAAKRQAAKLRLAFRSLDRFRALREPDRRRRDEERLFPARNKEAAKNQKQIP